jgi:uncharacterized membrane protein YhhN
VILSALICCFLGDFFLLWSKEKTFFIVGLLSFLMGHIFYTIAFLQTTYFLSGIPKWFYFSLLPFILIMSFASFSRIWALKGLSFWLPFVGSIFFIASDSLLAFRNFKVKLSRGWVSIMITYILAQLLIIFGFLCV